MSKWSQGSQSEISDGMRLLRTYCEARREQNETEKFPHPQQQRRKKEKKKEKKRSKNVNDTYFISFLSKEIGKVL